MKNKKFDCVNWVRDIRNKEYEQNKHLSLPEYADKMSKEVQKSKIFKEIITDRGVQIISPAIGQKGANKR